MEEDWIQFAKQAEKDYLVCYAEACPLREQCLHWLVGQRMPDSKMTYTCVNPRSKGAATEQCHYYRVAKKVKIAKGMTRIFTDDMPRRVEQGVRKTLIKRYNRTYYFEFRNGKQLIPPAMQEEIRQLFRHFGWNGEVKFDGYIMDYEW